MQPSNPQHPGDPERAYDIDMLRIKVVIQALAWASGYFVQRQERGMGHARASDAAGPEQLDAAAAALADKVREPDHCTQCGQVVPPLPALCLQCGHVAHPMPCNGGCKDCPLPK